MFKNLLNKIAGNPYEKEINRYRELVDQINALEPTMQALSDEQMRGLTESFRARIAEYLEGLDDPPARKEAEAEILLEILPEAFAAVREASVRTIGLRPFDVQLIGGIVLHESRIAEMKTGEGKTLVSSLPLYLNALLGRGAHLVTVNDYLVRRDGGWMGPIYYHLGMSTAAIGQNRYAAIFDPDYVDPGGDLEDERLVHWRAVPRRECYLADITYGTSSEFGFDYLRDHTALEVSRTVQGEHYYAIVDEVDSVLIDGARTPLIISGPAAQASTEYMRFARIIENARLKRNTTDLKVEEPDGDYDFDDRTRSVSLTDPGIEKVERQLTDIIDVEAGQSLYDPEFYDLVHYLENAVKAKYVFKRDVDYIVQGGDVILIDQTTGRPMPSRRYSEGLHQAIEAKEGVQVQREDETIATITVQNYFRLYDKLCGMTGTAITQAEEFDEVYTLDVVPIPTNVEFRATEGELRTKEEKIEGVPAVTYYQPNNTNEEPDYYRRVDLPDQVFININGKFDAVAQEMIALHEEGRPVLVGTGSVEASELLAGKLRALKIPHEVLNAKNHGREAMIVAQAGRPGAITISTSMAGRGTDILLGGNPEGLASSHIAERCFTAGDFRTVVTHVVNGDTSAARSVIGGSANMGLDLIPWIEQAHEVLRKKAGVEDVLRAVIDEIRAEPLYKGADFEVLANIVGQVNIAGIDARRIDRAREIADGAGLPGSLIPDIQYKLDEYRTIKGLTGREGLADVLARRLYESHYNARAAMIRAVLNDEMDAARRLTETIPSLPTELIADVQAIQEDCRAARRQVWEQGGLHIVGTERHEARRIDDQLRGRAGRQGDPGSSRFYLSLEDELMTRFGGERTRKIMERLNMPEDMPISANILSGVIEQAQSRFEGFYFDMRKNVVEYDEAVNYQRQVVYDERTAILTGDGSDLDNLIRQFIQETLGRVTERLMTNYEDWAAGEIENVIGDFSNFETGEVNARGVFGRVRSLFPRLEKEDYDDLLEIEDAEDLAAALNEFVADGVQQGHNLKILHAEIGRIVPLWPVAPGVRGTAIEGWEPYTRQVLATYQSYLRLLPEEEGAAALADLEAALESAFREGMSAANTGGSVSDVQNALYTPLQAALTDAFQRILFALEEPDALIDLLLERIDYLLTVVPMEPLERVDLTALNGSGWPLDQQVYAIGAEEMRNYQRALMLSLIDAEWRQYIKAIDDLRTGVGLAAFAQRDPKVEFKRRAFEMFDQLRSDVQDGVARRFFNDLPRHRQIVENQKRQDQMLDQMAQAGYRVQQNVSRRSDGSVKVTRTVTKDMWSSVGRNDPCPCGSGKKFKDCHYKTIREQAATTTVSAAPTGGGRSKKRGRRRR